MSNLYKFPPANASTSYGGGGAEPDIALLKFFTKPSLNKTNFDYSTSAQSPTILNFDSNFMVATGDTSATDPGDYTITVSFKSKKYCRWDDGTNDDIVLPWTMDPIKHFAKPYLNKTNFDYNYADPVKQGPTIRNFDSTYMTVTGDTSATNDGNYSITVAFKDTTTCRWSDNTTAAVKLPWSIVDNRTCISASDLFQISFNKDYKLAGNVYWFNKSDAPVTISFTWNTSLLDVSFDYSIWPDGWTSGTPTTDGTITRPGSLTLTKDHWRFWYRNGTMSVKDPSRYYWRNGTSKISSSALQIFAMVWAS